MVNLGLSFCILKFDSLEKDFNYIFDLFNFYSPLELLSKLKIEALGEETTNQNKLYDINYK